MRPSQQPAQSPTACSRRGRQNRTSECVDRGPIDGGQLSQHRRAPALFASATLMLSPRSCRPAIPRQLTGGAPAFGFRAMAPTPRGSRRRGRSRGRPSAKHGPGKPKAASDAVSGDPVDFRFVFPCLLLATMVEQGLAASSWRSAAGAAPRNAGRWPPRIPGPGSIRSDEETCASAETARDLRFQALHRGLPLDQLGGSAIAAFRFRRSCCPSRTAGFPSSSPAAAAFVTHQLPA